MPTIQKATKSNTTFVNLLVLVFLVVSFIGIINHEMWRDEFYAWMKARNSLSVSDLFKNLRYEGHPAIWHGCLYFITRFTHNPIAMQLFHLLLATGSVYVFAKFSPFTRVQKLLFSFGYFPFYEYSIISRNYSLGVIFIFLFCSLFPKRNQSYLLLSITVGLIANTNAYSLIIAISLAMTLVFELVINKDRNKFFVTKRWDLSISLIIFILGIVIALIQIIPVSSANYRGNQEILPQSQISTTNDLKKIALTLTTVWMSYIPIPNFLDYHFWNTNIFVIEGYEILQIFAVFFSLCLLFFSIALFIQKPVALFLYLSGTLGILLFTYEKNFGYLRHHGHLFILFLTCIWVSNYCTKLDILSRLFKSLIKFVNRYKNQYLTIILSVHVFVGIFAFTMDLIHPFSASKEVASFIESQQLNNTLIVGSRDFPASTVAALLNRKIYYPESDTFDTVIGLKNRHKVNSQEILGKIDKLIEQKNTNTLLVLNYKLDAARPDLSITKLLKSSRSIEPQETFYLYLIQRKPTGN